MAGDSTVVLSAKMQVASQKLADAVAEIVRDLTEGPKPETADDTAQFVINKLMGISCSMALAGYQGSEPKARVYLLKVLGFNMGLAVGRQEQAAMAQQAEQGGKPN